MSIDPVKESVRRSKCMQALPLTSIVAVPRRATKKQFRSEVFEVFTNSSKQIEKKLQAKDRDCI